MSIYSDDAVVITGQSKLGGKDSVANVWKNVIPYAKNFKIHQSVFSASDDMVFIEGFFTFDWNKDNYSAFCKGKTILVWKKQTNNSWKITYHEENHGDLVKVKL